MTVTLERKQPRVSIRWSIALELGAGAQEYPAPAATHVAHGIIRTRALLRLAGHDTGWAYKWRRVRHLSLIALISAFLLQLRFQLSTPVLSSSKLATMSGCGSGSCSNGDGCQCSAGCGCCKTLGEPTFGGLRNYNAENDCDCACPPTCFCVDCDK